MDLHLALDTVLRLAVEVAEVAPEGLLLHVPVLDVPVESAGGEAGHVTVGAFVMVDV